MLWGDMVWCLDRSRGGHIGDLLRPGKLHERGRLCGADSSGDRNRGGGLRGRALTELGRSFHDCSRVGTGRGAGRMERERDEAVGHNRLGRRLQAEGLSKAL